jgi:glutamate synthase domain-containing protein 1
MSKMAEIMLDIEELLREGYKPVTVAAMLNVPVQWVYDTENNLMQLADPRFYGPDYDE